MKDKKVKAQSLDEYDVFIGPLVNLIRWIQKVAFGIEDVGGKASFIGEYAIVDSVSEYDALTKYSVLIDGERWNLSCPSKLSKGDEVKIIDEKGLTLIGERVEFKRNAP